MRNETPEPEFGFWRAESRPTLGDWLIDTLVRHLACEPFQDPPHNTSKQFRSVEAHEHADTLGRR